MISTAQTPHGYLNSLPDDRKKVIEQLRNEILQNLPKGFEECMSYGMLAFAIPHKIYPPGYHCKPSEPLPFIYLASQKNHIAVYHMGLYADSDLYKWFIAEFPKHTSQKLDMGKCCIRFKNINNIPYELFGELASKMSPDEWIEYYEATVKK